jgi:hypothetical protein
MDSKRSEKPNDESVQARVSFRLPVMIEGDDAAGAPFIERTMADNVTRRGAFIETRRVLNPGSLLALNDADSSEARLCYVQVVWVRNSDDATPGVGVKLVSGNEQWMDYLIAHSVQAMDDDDDARSEE